MQTNRTRFMDIDENNYYVNSKMLPSKNKVRCSNEYHFNIVGIYRSIKFYDERAREKLDFYKKKRAEKSRAAQRNVSGYEARREFCIESRLYFRLGRMRNE